MKKLIKNGRIFDGTGNEAFIGDILVDGDRIIEVGMGLECNDSEIMTGSVANRFSIDGRGYIKPGYYADLTVFNEEKLKNGIPDQGKAFGIEKVFINGQMVLDGSKLNEEILCTSGRAMRASVLVNCEV